MKNLVWKNSRVDEGEHWIRSGVPQALTPRQYATVSDELEVQGDQPFTQ